MRAGPAGGDPQGPLTSPTTERRDIIAPASYPEGPPPEIAPEEVGPTPYDPEILVFADAPWITGPGIYLGVTPEQYHRDPVVGGSMTSSLARAVTPPKGTAAHGLYYLAQQRKKREDQDQRSYFDVGSGYHTLTLHKGAEIIEVEADSWRTNAAKAIRSAAYAAGNIPLLTKEAAVVRAMYAATMEHHECRVLFEPGTFTAEVVIVWDDPATGLRCRAMIDAVPDYAHRMRFVDLKTKAGHADPLSVSRSIGDFRYHQQFAFYLSGIEALIALGLLPPVEDIEPFLVVCGKDAPHVPLARPVDTESIEIGRVQNRKALDVLALAVASGQWPGYDDPAETPGPIGIPYWDKRRFEYDLRDGMYATTEEML